MQQANTTWTIIGTGAIGCLWASYLCQAGHKVLLVGRSKSVEAQTKNGQVTIALRPAKASGENNNGESSPAMCKYQVDYCPIEALSSLENELENILFATKSHQLLYACEQAKPYIKNGANILTLCNGMGFQSELAKLFPHANIYAAMSTDGALLHNTLDVEHTGKGMTFYGLIASHQSNETDTDSIRFPKLFNDSLSLTVEAVDDINLGLWKKFFINCVINTITAIYNIKNGELLNDALQSNLVIPLCNELEKVKTQTPLNSKHQSSQNSNPRLNVPEFSILDNVNQVAKITAANTSSMLKDRQEGKALELKYLNEFLLSFAQYHKIDLPISTKLYEMLIDEHSLQ